MKWTLRQESPGDGPESGDQRGRVGGDADRHLKRKFSRLARQFCNHLPSGPVRLVPITPLRCGTPFALLRRMANPDSRFNFLPTVDAIQILEALRRDQRGNIPFIAWRILSRTQERLEREVDLYLKGHSAQQPTTGRILDISVGRLASGE